MANPVIRFEGMETNFINQSQLKLTVKLVPQEYTQCSYGDVLCILEKEGLQPEDILGMYKVSSNDSSYSIFLADEEALQSLKDKKVIGNSRVKFNVVSMSEQVVTLRVHWLPLYYDNRLLKAIFCDYGEVLDVKMCKSSHARLVALNGMREVTLRTDEVLKQKIPHLVTFGCGQSILVTMYGRPPLCLKCREVGHLRKDCETSRSWAAVTRQERSGVVSPVSPPRPAASESPEGPASGSPAQVVVPSAPLSGTGDSGAVAAVPDSQEVVSDNEVMEEVAEVSKRAEIVSEIEAMEAVAGSSKRTHDSCDDDFITPNKTAKARTWSEESVPLTSSYAPIMGLADIMPDEQVSQNS